MSILNTIKDPIRQELDAFEHTFQHSLKTEIPLLNLIIKYLIRRKGKQIRPILVFLSAKISGSIGPSTYIAASMIEIMHTASLIHDDIVDESYERRNYFSINALWKSKIAVLFGDYLLAQGLLLSVKNREYECLQIVSDAVKEMSEGELMQIQLSRKLSITEDQYFEIIRKKTATLISACTASGARSVHATEQVVELMAGFGEKLGIAFQIRDDLIDYQLSSHAGKPSGNDIKEKKLTLPLIYAIQKSNTQEKRRVLSLINKGKSDSGGLSEIVQFINVKGGIDYSIKKMNEYRDEAIKILDFFPDSITKQSLRELSFYITSRRK